MSWAKTALQETRFEQAPAAIKPATSTTYVLSLSHVASHSAPKPVSSIKVPT